MYIFWGWGQILHIYFDVILMACESYEFEDDAHRYYCLK